MKNVAYFIIIIHYNLLGMLHTFYTYPWWNLQVNNYIILAVITLRLWMTHCTYKEHPVRHFVAIVSIQNLMEW